MCQIICFLRVPEKFRSSTLSGSAKPAPLKGVLKRTLGVQYLPCGRAHAPYLPPVDDRDSCRCLWFKDIYSAKKL